MTKKILLLPIIALFAFAPLSAPVNAANGVIELKSNLTGFGKNTGLSESNDKDLKTKIADIVNIVLGFLGILAVIMIIFGGFKWMTAGGNEETVTQAKGNIKNAVIGIVVVFLSFVIVNFAVSQLTDATGADRPLIDDGGGDGGGGGDIISEPVAAPTFNPTSFKADKISEYKFCDVGVVSSLFGITTCDTSPGFKICAEKESICNTINTTLRASRALCIDGRNDVSNSADDMDECEELFINKIDQITFRE